MDATYCMRQTNQLEFAQEQDSHDKNQQAIQGGTQTIDLQ